MASNSGPKTNVAGATFLKCPNDLVGSASAHLILLSRARIIFDDEEGIEDWVGHLPFSSGIKRDIRLAAHVREAARSERSSWAILPQSTPQRHIKRSAPRFYKRRLKAIAGEALRCATKISSKIIMTTAKK
jgi:hypothetical protein